MNNLLLEGQPGVGKTTLLRAVARAIPSARIGGFLTEEIRENGIRMGFRVETFDGRSAVLAHTAFRSGPVVGKYRVDVCAFEEIGVNGLERGLSEADILLVDEIGKMELCSERFKELVLRSLDSPKPLVATIMSRPHPFADRIKARPDGERLTVTVRNRDALADLLVQRLKAALGR